MGKNSPAGAVDEKVFLGRLVWASVLWLGRLPTAPVLGSGQTGGLAGRSVPADAWDSEILSFCETGSPFWRKPEREDPVRVCGQVQVPVQGNSSRVNSAEDSPLPSRLKVHTSDTDPDAELAADLGDSS